MRAAQILAIYQHLLTIYGRKAWWPAESNFEIMVGAVLTQNTAWRNVEKAIAKLKSSNSLSAEKILAHSDASLAAKIRSSGYYNIKTKRLKNLCLWLTDNGGEENLASIDTESLRASLLNVNGVGFETADDILLYALHRPVFIIDTYTRRLFSRLQLIQGNEPYAILQQTFQSALGLNVDIFQQYHALIISQAKEKCSNTKDCKHCHIEAWC